MFQINKNWAWLVPLAAECELICEVRGRSHAQGIILQNTSVENLRIAARQGDSLVRRKALHLLSLLESTPAVLEDLILALENDASPVVRHEAAYFLGTLRNGAAVAPLIKALLNDANELVRHEAAEALGDLGDDRAADALQKATTDSSEIVRETAMISLLQLKGVDSV